MGSGRSAGFQRHKYKLLIHLPESALHASDRLGFMMIVPLALEMEWKSVWARAPRWDPPATDVLFIAPHPDDETLAAGGFLSMQAAKGIPVKLIAVTDGEKAYEASPRLAEVRRAEQISAAKWLGVNAVDLIRLNLPDSRVATDQRALVERLTPLASRGTHILAPWTGDFHPDHEACGRAAAEVARRTGAALTFYFFWTWHRGTPALVEDLPLRSLTLGSDQRFAKEAALMQYVSQLQHPSNQPILPENLLWPARQPSEIFLPA